MSLRRRVAGACGWATIAIALLALAGWLSGRLVLASIRADFIPMAPATAASFVLLGGFLLAGGRPGCVGRWPAILGPVLVLAVVLWILGQQVAGVDLLEQWLFGRMSLFGRVSIGRMSPLTAGGLLAVCVALLLVGRWGDRALARETAASGAAGVIVMGLAVGVSYWYGALYLRGGGQIPMALTTVAAFVTLGAGILALSGPPLHSLRGYRPLFIGAGIGLTVSLLLFVTLEREEEGRIREEFEQKAERFASMLRFQLRDNLSELENIRALFMTAPGVGREAFRVFTGQILERHPQIRAFAWCPVVPDERRAAVEAAARREGLAGYRFTERDPDGTLRPAGRRPWYAPVLYQEPVERNPALLGFDILSSTARRQAMENAWRGGGAAATGPVQLVQVASDEQGILIFWAVYGRGEVAIEPGERRADVQGFVMETLSLGPLVRKVFPDLPWEGMEYRLTDTTEGSGGVLVAASKGPHRQSGLGFTGWISVADRRWRLEIFASPGFLEREAGDLAWVVLGGGLLLTSLLAVYLQASARHATEVGGYAEKLRKITRAIDQSPVSVVITDAAGTIEYVNPKFVELTGYQPEEVRGQSSRILRSGKTPIEEYQRLREAIRAGQEWRGVFCNQKKSGELYWEAASISPVRGSDGRITHFVAVKEDITERRRMEEEAQTRARQLETVRTVSMEIGRELKLDALLQLVLEEITRLVGDGVGMVRLWSESDQLLVPRAWSGPRGRRENMTLRLGEGVAGAAAERRAGLIVNDFRSSCYAIPKLTEGTTHTAVLAEPLLCRDRLVGVISITRDAGQEPFCETDRQLVQLFAGQAAIAIDNARLYQAVESHAATLEARVRERTRELERAREVAEAASARKSEFLATMSHEFRTPLNGILGFAELLARQGAGLSPERAERYVRHIQTSGRRLMAMVSQVLDYSAAEKGELELQCQTVDGAEVIREVAAEFRPLTAEKGQRLEVEVAGDLPRLQADQARLGQILRSLLSNAVKFTPAGGSVRVAARRVEEAPGVDQTETPRTEFLEIVVADDGIGIAVQDLERIFTEFAQVDSSAARRYEGVGIGLALVRRLVVLHGGRVWAESGGVGQGTRFVVRLPLVRAAPQARVLLVEDEVTLLRGLTSFLRDAGYELRVAYTEADALETLASFRPAAVVVDVGRPALGGWEIVRRARAGGPGGPRLLLLTGGEPGEAERARSAGGDAWLGRPVSAVEAVETLGRLLRKGSVA